MESAFRRKWLAAGWVLVVLVVAGSLMPHPPSPDIQQGDKLQHLFAYFLLMSWFAQLLRQGRIALAAALIGLGVAIEFVQGTTGWRSYDALDMVANMTGVLLGWLASPPRGPDLYGRVYAYVSRRTP